MQRVAKALNIERAEFAVSVDSITASVFDGSLFRTQIVRLPPLGVDMNLLCRIELLTRHLPTTRPEEMHPQLDALQSTPGLYPKWLGIMSLGAACGAFCAAGHGDALQILSTFVGTAAGHSVRLGMLARQKPLVSIVVTSAFSAALVSTLLVRLLHPGVPGATRDVIDLATVSSVLFLIPGVPLVNSLVDLVHLDVTAAMGRAAYATVLVGAIAAGVFGFISVFGILSSAVGL